MNNGDIIDNSFRVGQILALRRGIYERGDTSRVGSRRVSIRPVGETKSVWVWIPFDVASFVIVGFRHDAYLLLHITTGVVYSVYVPWVDEQMVDIQW